MSKTVRNRVTLSGEVDLVAEQRRILRSAAWSALLCAAVLTASCWLLPRFFQPPEALAERIAFAVQADLLVLVWLLVAVRMVSSGRYRSADDNRGSAFSAPSPALAIKVAFLQNTLEQVVLAVGAHVALATLVSGASLFFIPAAVLLFGIGRIAFLQGYPKGAGARSFGMATTALPTAAAFAWAIYLIGRDLLT